MEEKIKQVGLVVGIPTRGLRVAFEWAMCMTAQNYPMNVNRVISVVKGKPVDEARNKIVQFALEKKVKYLWFVDDDVAVPTFASKRLIYDLESADDDVMVAGGVYVTKQDDLPEPCVFMENGMGAHWKWKKGDVFECSGIGTGCMMIKTEVFQHLEQPWFKTVDTMHTNGKVVSETMTDDLYFCNKVKNAGYKILCDGNVLCVHWEYSFDPPKPYTLPEDSWPLKAEREHGMMP